MLQLGQQVAHVLGVQTSPPARGRPRRARPLEPGVGQDGVDRGVPLPPQRRRVGGDAGGDAAPQQVVALEQLGGVRPDLGQTGGDAGPGLLGPVAQAHHPAGRVVQVVAGLLDGATGHRSQGLVRGTGQGRVERHLEGADQQLPGHRPTEVAVGQLHELDVAELPLVTPVREVVLGPPAAVELAGPCEQRARLTQQVKADVEQGDVLLDRRPAGGPLPQPLGQHQRVVTQPQRVRGHVVGGGAVAHRFWTSSGTT